MLERWCRAVGDLRARWISPLAPLRNYTALLSALIECWQGQYLPHATLGELTRTLLAALVRDEQSPGFLWRLEDAERRSALEALHPATRGAAAALVYAVFRDLQGDQQTLPAQVFDWQPILVPALELGVLSATEGSGRLAARLLGAEHTSLPEGSVRAYLDDLAHYVDDPRWLARLNAVFGVQAHFGPRSTTDDEDGSATLVVEGIAEPLDDPRLVQIGREAMEYRSARELLLVLDAAGETRRIMVDLGGYPSARIGRQRLDASQVLRAQDLAALAEHGGSWRAVFPPAA